jgi:diacylglycerol kinase family enzyme
VQLEMDKPFPILLDGELLNLSNVQVDVLPQAIRFVVPKGASHIADKETKK